MAMSEVIYKVPVLGRLVREQTEGDPDNPLYLILALVCLWASAVVIWGLPALYLPAVALAPLCLVMLVLITRG